MLVADDSSEWLSAASRHLELAAHQIARFRNPSWSPPWQDLVPKGSSSPDPFSDDSSSQNVVSDGPTWQHEFNPRWGLHRRRSTRTLKKSSPVYSPVTPLDIGSGSGSDSTCAGDEGSSLRVGDRAAVTVSGWANDNKVAAMEDTPSASRKPCSNSNITSKQIGIKRKINQLQEEENSLLEEKNRLQKVMKAEKKKYEALKSENDRLKNKQNKMKIEKNLAEFASTPAAPSSSACFVLPDLNEPCPENDC